MMLSRQGFRSRVSVLAIGFLLPLHATWAQSTTAAPSETRVATQTAAGRLADNYATAIGSADDARAVVEAMRTGQAVTVESGSVAGTGKTMGFGNIDIALSLARSQVGPQATSQDFMSALDGVMGQRASGMGWGEIAKSLGVNLGQVMSDAKRARASEPARSGKPAGAAVAVAGKSGPQGDAGKNGGHRGDAGGSGNSAGGNGNGNAGGNGGGNGGGGGKK